MPEISHFCCYFLLCLRLYSFDSKKFSVSVQYDYMSGHSNIFVTVVVVITLKKCIFFVVFAKMGR